MVKIPYYVRTLRELACVLAGVEIKEDPTGKPTRGHIMFMASRVAKLDRGSIKEAVEAGRLIGRILLAAEINYLWDHKFSEYLLQIDRREGNDLPAVDKTT